MRGWAGRPPKRPTRLFRQLPSPTPPGDSTVGAGKGWSKGLEPTPLAGAPHLSGGGHFPGAWWGPTSQAESARAWGEDAVSRASSHPPPLLLGACHPSNIWLESAPGPGQHLGRRTQQVGYSVPHRDNAKTPSRSPRSCFLKSLHPFPSLLSNKWFL